MHLRRSASGPRFRQVARLCATLAAGVTAFTLAHADLVIVQKVDGGGQQGDMTVKISGTKTRFDLAQPASIISDLATGESIVLQHNVKLFTKLSPEQTKDLAEKMAKAQNAAGDPPKLEATGQKEKIEGYEAELFNWSVGTLKLKFWVVKDYPNGQLIQDEMAKLQQSGLSAIAASLMPKPAELPGVRIRTEMDVNGKKISYTITSVKEEPVDPALFEIPKDYKEVQIPGK